MRAASDKLRQQYKEELIKCLVEQPLSSTGMDSQYSMREEIYIDLLVLPSSTVDEEWTNSDRKALLKQEFLDRSASEKAFDRLFLPDDELIVIRGVAGIGKSTLIDMFTFKWAKKELRCQDFDFVFKFTCREINEIAEEVNNLENLFKRMFPDVFDLVSLQDLSVVSEKILIIVDGLDELKDIYQMDGANQSTNQEAYLRVVFDLINTKCNKMFKNHKTFACGRPKACEFVKRPLSQTCKIKTIEVCGFNRANIQKYILNFFNKDQVKAEKVNNAIELSPNLKLMSSVPVFLWVICSVYNENLIDRHINTNTELYFYTCLILIRNHLQPSSNKYSNLIDVVNDKTIVEVVYSLMVLSVKTYMQNQVIFTDKDIEGVKCPVHLEQTGFLVKYSRGNTDESKYQFRHLVLQEFLCALYLCVTKNISPFLSNCELPSCTPTIHGIHRIIGEAQNEVYIKFYCALTNTHENSTGWFLGESTKSSREELYQNFINETKIKIPKSMIEDHTLVIDDDGNPSCVEFLDIFKETNIQVNAPNIHSTKITLISYKDYANILHLLEHLKVEKIESLKGRTYNNEINKDLSKLCKMVTGENFSTSVLLAPPFQYYFSLECCFRSIEILHNPINPISKIVLIPQDLMDISETFNIVFNSDWSSRIKEEIGRITRYAIQNKKNIRLQNFTMNIEKPKNIVPTLLMELDIDSSNKYISIEEPYMEYHGPRERGGQGGHGPPQYFAKKSTFFL